MVSNRALKCMVLMLVTTVFMPAAVAKDKGPLMPVYILNARTVAVVIDRNAGRELTDPNANETAQRDVEAALLKWGRFETVLNPSEADLVIVLHKGTGKLADATVNDPRQNRRGASTASTDGAIGIGVQRGPHGGETSSDADPVRLHPQAEVGYRDDSFVVYAGRTDPGASGVVGWRYVHKDALHSHDVPAVDEFRKALAEAEKKAAEQKKP